MANQWYVCLDFAKLSKVLSIFQSIRPVMAKLYKVMTRYDQIIQIYTSYGQTRMLYKVTARIGHVVQSFG